MIGQVSSCNNHKISEKAVLLLWFHCCSSSSISVSKERNTFGQQFLYKLHIKRFEKVRTCLKVFTVLLIETIIQKIYFVGKPPLLCYTLHIIIKFIDVFENWLSLAVSFCTRSNNHYASAFVVVSKTYWQETKNIYILFQSTLVASIN